MWTLHKRMEYKWRKTFFHNWERERRTGRESVEVEFSSWGEEWRVGVRESGDSREWKMVGEQKRASNKRPNGSKIFLCKRRCGWERRGEKELDEWSDWVLVEIRFSTFEILCVVWLGDFARGDALLLSFAGDELGPWLGLLFRRVMRKTVFVFVAWHTTLLRIYRKNEMCVIILCV